jgi:hypothetical protein
MRRAKREIPVQVRSRKPDLRAGFTDFRPGQEGGRATGGICLVYHERFCYRGRGVAIRGL